jgi:TRAP-type C4-dicarboxylate transport system substrate-binding protein
MALLVGVRRRGSEVHPITRGCGLGLALLVWSRLAVGAPVELRMASLAPEGTQWARELKAVAREVESSSHGQVRMKWYLGGIAGDELQVIDRIRRGQLDGTAGAGFCERLAPSLRAPRMIGTVQNREEVRYVMSRMRNRLDAEMAKNGFVAVSYSTFGIPILITRNALGSMEQLRSLKLWVWNGDDVARRALASMGIPVVSTDVTEAAAAYADGRVDGFVATPTAALAYQWSAQARYFTELPIGFLPGCMVIVQRAMDSLPIDAQRAIRSAGAQLGVRFDEAGHLQEEALIGGLFERQGLKRAGPSEDFRHQFLEEARRARDTVAADLFPSELLKSVLAWVADLRAEHR